MDRVSKVSRSVIMSRIRGSGNKRTEKNLADLLHKSKIIGWRRHQTIHFDSKRLRNVMASDGTVFKSRVRPDFSFPKLKIALFIDGCFWHGCTKCYREPKSRKKFWSGKIHRNIERDRFQVRQLKRHGWTVIRIRECDLQKRPMSCIRRISRCLNPKK